MADRRAETPLRDIDALFRLGTISGLSDGQLLERFTEPTDSNGEIAFEAVVRRHGPMVLGVCLRALGDYHAAEDAFQATFMVLALKTGSIRKKDSLGPWLHGVAVRISQRARVRRRRTRAEPILDTGVAAAPGDFDAESFEIGPVLDEELSRLPDKYRRPIVLCYLEGQSQDEAARARVGRRGRFQAVSRAQGPSSSSPYTAGVGAVGGPGGHGAHTAIDNRGRVFDFAPTDSPGRRRDPGRS